MSFFRKKLTDVAVDSFTVYLTEKLEKIKQLDLDKDGEKDVDQMMVILHRCASLAKQGFEATDYQKLATGFEMITSGAGMVGEAVDSKTLKEIGHEMYKGLSKFAELAQLGIHEIKTKGTLNDE